MGPAIYFYMLLLLSAFAFAPHYSHSLLCALSWLPALAFFGISFLTPDCIVGILSYKILTFHAYVMAWFLNPSSPIAAISLLESSSAMYSGYIQFRTSKTGLWYLQRPIDFPKSQYFVMLAQMYLPFSLFSLRFLPEEWTVRSLFLHWRCLNICLFIHQRHDESLHVCFKTRSFPVLLSNSTVKLFINKGFKTSRALLFDVFY